MGIWSNAGPGAMSPAYSVIFFTTAAGAGYGLLALAASFSLAGLIPPDRWVGVVTTGLALAGITAGLLSSTFHLGHPERAWRAFTQWRSSWLSREGVLSTLTYLPAGAFAIGWVVFEDRSGWWAAAAAASVVGAALTVHATGMIYASLPLIAAWANRWVVPNYLVLALATGGLVLDAVAAAFGFLAAPFLAVTAAALAGALWLKWSYWRHIDSTPGPATPESATGLTGLGAVRLLEPPSTRESYVQREMGYRIARKHARKLRSVAIVALYVLPLALTLAALAGPDWARVVETAVAILVAAPGVVVERWLFFAEAKHTVMLYFGAPSA